MFLVIETKTLIHVDCIPRRLSGEHSARYIKSTTLKVATIPPIKYPRTNSSMERKNLDKIKQLDEIIANIDLKKFIAFFEKMCKKFKAPGRFELSLLDPKSRVLTTRLRSRFAQ
jgi:hypothetical protein